MTEETTDVENVEVQPDAVDQSKVLGMSDEDFMNADPSEMVDIETPFDKGDEEFGVPTEQREENNDENNPDETLGDGEHGEELEDDTNVDGDSDNAENENPEEVEADNEDPGDQPTEASNDGDEIDYEAEYKKLFEPIKSSGREIKMRNVDHVRNYIQMGDDYNKKMHELKPYMKSLRTLKQFELIGSDTSDDRLNFLIELDQKNPEAIKKLIADSGLDIYELQDEDKFSPEKSKAYKPSNKIVSENEVGIEDALNDISGSETYQRTINVMTKEFDEKSRDIIAENPGYIRSLNHDMANGSYDRIMEEVKYARDMKYIPENMSDIEAYIATVQMLGKEQSSKGQGLPAPKKTTRKVSGNNRRKKVGMSSSSSQPAKKKDTGELDYIGMSDEDFAKLDNEVL